MPGPARTPGSRRDDKTEWTVLPAKGRVGDPPKLPFDAPAEVQRWWEWLWSTPQATQWSESDQVLVRLAILVGMVFSGQAAAAVLSEIRQLEDRYGLNPKAMHQLRWVVEAGAEAVTPPVPGADELEKQRRRRRQAAAG